MRTPFSAPVVIDGYFSSPEGQVLTPSALSTPPDPRLIESRQPFSLEGYTRPTDLPVAISTQSARAIDATYLRCLDMPLRLAGTESYHLPEEWSDLAPLLTEIIEVEHVHNPHWVDYHTYLTIDCRDVRAEEQQRRGGLHVDGFQGERINPKTKITRNYVLTTNGGTRFYPQSFTVVDPARFNVFQGFDLQAQRPVIAPEGVVHFMDAYTVHESGLASRDGRRTFLRLTYDLKIFDRAGNTHNSMLDYEWEMVDRDVHSTVTTPTARNLQDPSAVIYFAQSA